MTNVMSLDAFGEQTFAPALPPASENRPTCFSPHSRTKTVLTFPCSLGWLVSALHDKSGENFLLLSGEPLTVGVRIALSIAGGSRTFDSEIASASDF